VVQEPAEEALRPLRHLQQDALLWLGVGLLAAVVLGFTSVRSVTAPVRKLREAVVAVASGALDTPVEIKRSDELGELADAFNTMTRGLREREGLKLTLALSESLKLDDVLGRLLDGLRDAVPFEEGAVLIKTRDGLDVIVTRGSRGKRESERIVPISSHVERALRTLLPALNEGRQMMALPLIQHGVAIGVVCLESRNAYGESDVRLALSLTQPAAMAVENARLFDEVNRLATLDGLTGIYNRRHFMDQALRAYETARRFGQPLTALMLDVDHFKTVNDRYGHHVGDQVLRVLAERCRGALRSVDVLGRFGGEEFAILLPGTTQQSAANILAERIRRRVADDPVPTDAGPVKVTVSVGVAAIDEQTRHPDDLLKRADAALYEAKQAGRNRVVEDAVA
jgi:diguanylate cyclase (GGDEF)-like protein